MPSRKQNPFSLPQMSVGVSASPSPCQSQILFISFMFPSLMGIKMVSQLLFSFLWFQVRSNTISYNNNNNNNKQNTSSILLNTYFVPGTFLSTFHIVSHWILKAVLWSRYYYCPYCTNEELRHKEVKKFAKGHTTRKRPNQDLSTRAYVS